MNELTLIKSELNEIEKWLQQGYLFGFYGKGYGRFAHGIPCSYYFRTKKR